MRIFLLLPAVLAVASLAGCDTSGLTIVSPPSNLKPGSEEYAYFEESCHHGAEDARLSFRNNYKSAWKRNEAYHDYYDARYEPYFQQGYEACWAANRQL